MIDLSWLRLLTAGLLMLIAGWLTACAPLMPTFSRIATPTVQPAAAVSLATLEISAVPVTPLLQAAPLGDEPAQPVYTLVTHSKDWDSLSGQIPEAALQAGRAASAAGNPVIVAFAGMKGSSGYQVDVPRVALQADQLIVAVEVTGPDADDIVEPATTLPFALATIPTDALSEAHWYVIVDDSGQELTRDRLAMP